MGLQEFLSVKEQIRQLYRDLLGREAEPDGLRHWTREVELTGDLQTANNGIRASAEYQRFSKAQAIHKQTVFSNIPCLVRPERIEKLTFNGYSRS